MAIDVMIICPAVFVMMVFGLVAGGIAQDKGLNTALWFIGGAVTGPVGIVLALIAPGRQ